MRIAIISMSTGSGHVRAAYAIASYAKTYTDHEVMHVDAADFIHPVLKLYHIKIYGFLSEYLPKVWGFLYKITNRPSSSNATKINITLQRGLAKKLHEKILSFKPDAIICTYFGSAQLVEPLSTKYKIPVHLVLTDYEAHAMFVMDHVNKYFVPTDEVKQQLQKYGAAKNNIYTSGIPIDHTFYLKKNPDELKAKHGISQTEKVLLIIAKTYRGSTVKKILRQIESVPGLSVLIIGKHLDIPASKRVKNIGWTGDIEEYMRMADVVITKSGGLTSSECMTLGKYMIILGPIPGQEEANANYVVESGRGAWCKDIKIIYTLVKACISMPRAVIEEKNPDDNPCKKILDAITS